MIAHLSFARPLFAAMPRVCGGNLPAHNARKKKLTQRRAGKQKKKEIQGRWRSLVQYSSESPTPNLGQAETTRVPLAVSGFVSSIYDKQQAIGPRSDYSDY